MKNIFLPLAIGLLTTTLALLSFDDGDVQSGGFSTAYAPIPQQYLETDGRPADQQETLAHSDNTSETADAGLPSSELQYQSFSLELGDADFKGMSTMQPTVEGISSDELAPLNAGMVNVTAGYAAYRLGLTLEALKSFRLTMPFDASLLPPGYSADDVQTYCHDPHTGRWLSVPRDSVETELQLVLSSAELPLAVGNGEGDGALDFINAVIKTPEMPEAASYTPTSIKELEAANPLEGMTLMQPPTANSSGTANLSYPIEIPAGRQGMQPSLALTYNSGGGNGWLGVGWDISIPSITVETRWGVPRYDQSKESEVYVYEGEQLVTKDGNGNFREMPHRTNQWTNRLPANTQFFPRKDEAHDSIVRHGSGPDSYWWSVTHRNGVTDYYGKQKGSDVVDYESVLCDPTSHNIAQWMLTESVDADGNWVRYYYDKIQSARIDNDTRVQLYLDSISYTGHPELSATYAIKFHSDGIRQDVITNARYGFREEMDRKLCRFDVLYEDTVIRSYHFVTENDRNTLFKTRLADVVRIDLLTSCSDLNQIECDSVLKKLVQGKDYFQRTHFDYFNYPKEDSLYGPGVLIQNLPDDDIKSSFRLNQNNSTALGAYNGYSASFGGTLSVGVCDENFAVTTFNVGGNFNYSQSATEGLMTLIDLDGDGYSDKVFKENGRLYYRPMIVDTSDNDRFNFGEKILVTGIYDFIVEESHSPSFGLQGSIPIMAASAGGPKTVSYTSTYFADVNGDGLVDLVTDYGPYFNSLDADGHPTFTAINEMRISEDAQAGGGLNQVISTSATSPCGGIIFDGEVDTNMFCTVSYDTIATKFNSLVERLEDLLDNPKYVNCIVVSIGDSSRGSVPVMLVDTARRHVECGPVTSEPDLDAVKVWVAPRNGEVSVSSTIGMLPDHSESFAQSRYADGVRYRIEKASNCYVDADYILHADTSTVLTNILNKCDTILQNDQFTTHVNTNDIIFFRLQSNVSRDFDRCLWNQVIQYTDGCYGNDQYGKPCRIYDSQEDFILTGRSLFQAAKRGTVLVSGSLSGNPGTGGVKLLICKNETAVDSFEISGGYDSFESIHSIISINGGDSILFKLIPATSSPVDWGGVVCRPYLQFIEDTTDHTYSLPDTISCYPPVRYDIHRGQTSDQLNSLEKFFGPLYRGWGQFAYNNNDSASASHAIDVSKLILPAYYTGNLSTLDSSSITSAMESLNLVLDSSGSNNVSMNGLESAIDTIFNPLSKRTRWVEMSPDCELQAWMGFGGTTLISREQIHNTRKTIQLPIRSVPESNPSDTVQYVEIPAHDSPIPRSANGFPIQTIRKCNESKNREGSLSMIFSEDYENPNASSFSMGGSISNGCNGIVSDYLDLNGDRFPDLLCKNNVQYTNPWGGIGSMKTLNYINEYISSANTDANGNTFSGSYPTPKRQPGGNAQRAKIDLDAVGFGSVRSEDYSHVMYLDINGDGLPDRVYEDGYVALNVGYGFNVKENWNTGTARKGSGLNESENIGVSFNVEQESIGGGLGMNKSTNITEKSLMDMNADGMPDKVEKVGGLLLVKYNIGKGVWSSTDTIPCLITVGESTSFSESANGSITLGFPIMNIVKIQTGIQLAPYNSSFSTDDKQLTDINGDGFPDYVTSGDESSMVVRYNRSGKANLLRKVTNFTGSSIELDYEMPIAKYEKPQRSWNLSNVEVNNNVDTCPVGGNRSHTSFLYGKPNYNRYERMDYGYDTVVTLQHDTDNGDTIYRKTITGYNNTSYFKRGRKTTETILDAQNRIYIEWINQAELWDDLGSVYDETTCVTSGLYVGREAEITNYYEGDSQPSITVAVQKRYDNKRNVVKYIYEGDPASGFSEYFEADIHYKSGMPHNLISLQDSFMVKDHAGNLLQERLAQYDQHGHLIRIVQVNNGSGDAIYDFHYDQFGCVDSMTYPVNDANQRLLMTYEYDPVVHSYPTRILNASLGYYSMANYDYKFGKPTATIDVNGNRMLYKYDFMGRLDTLIAPNEDGIAPYTICMKYQTHHYGVLDIFHNGNNPYSVAQTYHYDVQHPNNPIVTVLVCDGLGRTLQTKKNAEINGQEVNLVSGKVEYDCFGRAVRQYHPFTEPLTSASIYNDSVVSGTASFTKYDILDRQTEVVLPLNSYTMQYEYGFGNASGNTCFRTTVTDPNGNSVTTLSGSHKQQLAIIAPMNAVTTFEYSPIMQLLKSTDPDSLSTTYQYDMLGRMTQRNHPDAGIDKYVYDPAGNLTNHTNGNGQATNYQYNYNQLTDISYPDYPANDVHYTYGSMGAVENRAGRIAMQEDASGWQTFSYGKLGEVTENIRTFALPFESKPYTFRMKYKYDSFNRMQQMTYPDGEVVHYSYNLGGMLEHIDGRKGLNSYKYIQNIEYNQFELKDSVQYGNGTKIAYRYDILQRLDTLRSYTENGEMMQDIKYDYDAVGNITNIRNGAATLSNGLGGPYQCNYSYDQLYRLASAGGSWNGACSNNYSVNMGYFANGRIKNKNVYADVLDHLGHVTHQNYQRVYQYGNDNRLLKIIDEQENRVQYFEWDHAGNMTQHRQIERECDRNFCWDEENRLQGVADCNYASLYQYDASGERTYKLTGKYSYQNINGRYYPYAVLDNPTLYASPYVVCTPKGYTKHYYAESERVASKIGNGCLRDLCKSLNTDADFNKEDEPENPYLIDCYEVNEVFKRKLEHNNLYGNEIMECISAGNFIVGSKLGDIYERIGCINENEKECYWYHPDHLGSSSWITFTDGKAVQHLHYLPWGEDFVDQRLTSWSARFTFSAKERDTETGLSYFGARYYSSDLSIWLSVDPMSGKYPSLSPYTYCANNPVKLVDPNGEEVWIIGEDGSRVIYTPGMTYDGQDKSISSKVNILNQMNSTIGGKILLGELTSSSNVYVITDNSPDDNINSPHFCANDDSKGKSGGVIVTNGQNDLGTISHELFHAYQDENGQGKRSIHNEVEAMLFQTSVVTEYGWNNAIVYKASPLLGDNVDYNTSVDDLLNTFSPTSMDKVIKGFKAYSGANGGGTYDSNYPLKRSNQSKHLIENFYPLLPWKK